MKKSILMLIAISFFFTCKKKDEVSPTPDPVVNPNNNTIVKHKFECKFYCKSGKYRRTYHYVDSVSHPSSVLLASKTDTSFSVNSDASYKFIKGSPYQYSHSASIINLSTVGGDSVRIDFYVDGNLCQSKSGIDGVSIVCMY